MRKLGTNPNVDNSDLVNFPDGRIKNNTGAGDGTAVNERVYGDIHSNVSKLIRLANISYNGLADSESNGFQIVEALRDLGSKHDVMHNITSTTGVLGITAKLNTMLVDEFLIAKSSVDLTTETTIKGTDLNVFAITTIGTFKTGEFIRLQKTLAGFTIIRLVDAVNLDAFVSELLYLKKASQAQENAGLLDTVSTTPLSNLTAFILRVNGVDSATYLATALQNGLYPKEHFEFVDTFVNSTRNIGEFSGYDPGAGTVGANLPISGDISNAEIVQVNSGVTVVECTMDNAMDNTDYEVQMSVESQSTFLQDTTVYVPIFKAISTTVFQVAMREPGSFTQNLKIHLRVIQK